MADLSKLKDMAEDLEPGDLLIDRWSSFKDPILYIVVSRGWVLEENPSINREDLEKKIPVKQLGVNEALFYIDPRTVILLDNTDHFLIMDNIESIRLYYQSFQANKGIGSIKLSQMRSEFALYVMFISCGGNVALIPTQDREPYEFYFNQLRNALNHKAAS